MGNVKMINFYGLLLPYNKEYTSHERNGMFFRREAAIWYAVLRYFKPKHLVEIGAGHSTNVAALALKANRQEDGFNRCEHTVIEPYRSKVVKASVREQIRVAVKKVQFVAFDDYFGKLQPNDVVFIDSSHVTQPYGDTIMELLFILPRLPMGVVVFIHDIYLPFDYRGGGAAADWKPHYTEQWMLAAFLYGNKNWEILFAPIYLELVVNSTFFKGGIGGQRFDSGAMYIRKIA